MIMRKVIQMKKQPGIIPAVRYYETTGRAAAVPETITCSAGFDEAAVKVFAENLAAIGRKAVIRDARSDEKKAGSGTWITLDEDPSYGEEQYRLTVSPEGILVQTGTKSGQLYALVTLFQLIAGKSFEKSPDGNSLNGNPENSMAAGSLFLETGVIEDGSAVPVRSFSLDVSRHFFDAAEVKRLLNQAALLKLNTFHFHVSDDRGYRLPSAKFPLLNQVGSRRVEEDGTVSSGHYTRQEIDELVQYAADRNITIIPEIDMPGHSLAMIAAYPSLSCSGRKREVSISGGIEKQILCGGSRKTRQFLKNLFSEVCEMFPGSFIHLGGDEAPKDEWTNCPVCGEYMKRHGFSSEEELQADLLSEMSDYVKTLGKTAICWNDGLKAGTLPGSVIIQYWDELHPQPDMMREVKNGRRILFSNIQSLYADYGYGMTPLQATYEYQPQMLGQNVPDSCVFGMEETMWTEWVSENDALEKLLFPRLPAFAEAAWSVPENRDYQDFLKRLSGYEKVLRTFGIRDTDISEMPVPRRIVCDAIRMHMIEPGKTTRDLASMRLTGWLQYLQGAYITREQREEALRQVMNMLPAA